MINLLPLHKRQCLVTIIFTNLQLPSLLPLSFHEMIFILVLSMGERLPVRLSLASSNPLPSYSLASKTPFLPQTICMSPDMEYQLGTQDIKKKYLSLPQFMQLLSNVDGQISILCSTNELVDKLLVSVLNPSINKELHCQKLRIHLSPGTTG